MVVGQALNCDCGGEVDGLPVCGGRHDDAHLCQKCGNSLVMCVSCRKRWAHCGDLVCDSCDD
jgi:hypothetical protein